MARSGSGPTIAMSVTMICMMVISLFVVAFAMLFTLRSEFATGFKVACTAMYLATACFAVWGIVKAIRQLRRDWK
jgi:hypothetical protein